MGCITWLIVISMRKLGHPVPLLNSYLDDLAAVPVLANLGLWFQRVFVVRNDYYVLSARQIIFIVVYVSILFELVLPYYSKVYTADWIDVVLYLTGGIFFYRIVNQPIMPETRGIRGV